METWITKICQSICRRIAVCAAILMAMLLFASANTRYITNFMNGPYTMSASELRQVIAPELSPQYYVRIYGTKTVDTGLQEFRVEKKGGREVSRSVSASYIALEVGERFLLVKTRSAGSKVFEGELAPLTKGIEMNFFQMPNVKKYWDNFYPYYLDTASFKTPGYIFGGIGIVVLMILLWYGIPAWRYLKNPQTHPVAQRVASWGDPICIPMEIENEYSSKVFLRAGDYTLTDRYIIGKTFFNFDVFRIADLLWAYKSITKQSINFIPVGKTYSAVLICYGGSATIRGKEPMVNSVLEYLAGKAPWSIFGYSDEIQKLFKKSQTEFCAIVEARRRSAADAGKTVKS